MATDIRAILAEQGLTPEEVAALVGNEKNAKAMSAIVSKYDEGLTLSATAKAELEKAEAVKLDAENYWEQKITPALAGVDKKVATANSEAARYKAYLQTLKDQGYDVPADLLTAPANPNPNPNPVDPGKFTRDDFQTEMKTFAPTMVTLMSLSNRYQDLYGTPYLTAEQDFAEAQAAHKPMREYVAAKYKFEDKTKEKSAAAEKTRIDAIVKEQVDTERAKLAAQYGSPETRAPLASKFDKIEKARETAGKDAWKSTKGREEARKSRLQRFENVTLQ